MAFNMKQELGHGKRGELNIVEAYSDILVHSPDVSEYDIISIPNNKTIEVKTEYRYNLQNTPNFFMERYSDDVNYKLGGPWRALEDKVDLYVQYFIQDSILFIFSDLKSLVQGLDSQILGRRFVIIPQDHGRYNTLGIPIARSSLSSFYEQIKLGERKELFL